MPTERFYRLSKEKADTIRSAAVQEFKRVPPEEASINKIIQTADISRGSFYTYFLDKYDLLEWLMGDFVDDYRRFYIDGLKENGGDLWDIYGRVLEYTIQWVAEQGLVEIVGNMMKGNLFAEQMVNGLGCAREIEAANIQYAEEMYASVDPACCQLSREEFDELLRMHIVTLVMALKAYFTKEKSLDVIKASYDRSMKLLRYGACPEQK